MIKSAKVRRQIGVTIPRRAAECRTLETWLQGPDNPPERGAIMATGVLCKAKQSEEEESCARIDPTAHLNRDDVGVVHTPDYGRNLDNLPELVMGVGPRFIW